jgi:predicted nucleic acid-binding protein
LKSEKIWKIWKKGKLHSEMIWKIWKISVLVIITPKETSSSSSSSLYTLFFRIEKNHPGIVFVRDYASRDQIYNFIFILFLEIPQ